MKVRVALLSCLLLVVAPARAQKAPPTVFNLIVRCTCDDSVGKAYARALRDLIAKSPRYEEIPDSKENRKRALLISIVTLPLGDDSSGDAYGAAISVVFVFDGELVQQYIQISGQSAVGGSAQKTLDSVDDLLHPS